MSRDKLPLALPRPEFWVFRDGRATSVNLESRTRWENRDGCLFRVCLSGRRELDYRAMSVPMSYEAEIWLVRQVREARLEEAQIQATLTQFIVSHVLKHAEQRETRPILSDDCYIGAFLENNDAAPPIVEALADLLASFDDNDLTLTGLGAALSLDLTLHQVRRAGRALFKREWILATPATKPDDELTEWNPLREIQFKAGGRAAFEAWRLRAQPAQHDQRLRWRDLESLHPRVRKAVESLVQNGHLMQAQEEAFMAVNMLVRERVGVEDDTGRGLMQQVFSIEPPTAAMKRLHVAADLTTKDGKNLQNGIGLFMEGIQCLRNKVSHSRTALGEDDERAMELIVLASALARLVDKTDLRVALEEPSSK